MSQSIIPIKFLDSISTDTLIIDESILKRYNIPKGQHIIIQFGSNQRFVKVFPSVKKTGVKLNPKLAAGLGVPESKNKSMPLRMIYDSRSMTLRIGPVVAVLINKETPETPDKPFGTISSFCTELVQACSIYGTAVYFLTPNLLKSSFQPMTGWIYDDQQWKKQIVPFPDVIYNRLPTRKLENQDEVKKLFQLAKLQYRIPIFNEKFLDKHEVFHALQQEELTQQYLPESHLFANYEQLRAMCKKYDTLYLKPVQGSLGKGIIQIQRTFPDNSYRILYNTSSGIKKQHYSQLLKLYRTIRPKLKKRLFQIQEGLTLIHVNQKPVDFRALIQKNLHGEWSITSIVARTAGDEQFVSNIARGGSLSTVIEALEMSNLPPHISRNELNLKLRQVALAIGKSLDHSIDLHFGELGIDLAVDVSGKIWLIEVNSKPSKNDNTPLQKNKIRPSVKKVLMYSRFLSGFEEGRNHNESYKSRRDSD